MKIIYEELKNRPSKEKDMTGGNKRSNQKNWLNYDK